MEHDLQDEQHDDAPDEATQADGVPDNSWHPTQGDKVLIVITGALFVTALVAAFSLLRPH